MSIYQEKLLEYLTKMQEASGLDPNWRPKPIVAPASMQAPQGGGIGDAIKGAAVKKIAGLAGASAAPSIAPMATALPTTGAFAAGPSMMLPAMTPMAPSAASTAAAAAPAAAGYGTLGTIGAGAAAVAAPIVFGSLVDKYFFKDKPDRKFNVEELLKNDVDNVGRIGAKVQGYDTLATDAKTKLLNALQANKTLVMPGYATKEGETVRRVGEDINWGPLRRLLSDKTQDDKFHGYNSSWVPEEQDVLNLRVNKRINQDLTDRYINTIRALKEAGGGNA
jgi:hypothetical protein